MQQKPRVQRLFPFLREGKRSEPLAAFERPLQILRRSPRPVLPGLGRTSAVERRRTSVDTHLLLEASGRFWRRERSR